MKVLLPHIRHMFQALTNGNNNVLGEDDFNTSKVFAFQNILCPLELYLVIRTRVFMAEQMFMFATTAGFIIGLAVLLFVVRGRRSNGVKATISGHDEGDKGRKVKSR